ncbi:MAG: A/G-specific adenine glycosylase [Verrucomicrobiota bacterium]
MNPQTAEKITGWGIPLLGWYRENGRDLPWRRSPSFYRVWVSEVMLQQTRVETATAYFEPFLDRFPSVADLANADLQDVLKLWEGLGYYSRARNLHKAAKVLHFDRGDDLPQSAETLRQLPGFGEYISAAVASIVYAEAVPVLDGNVLRVMARFLAVDTPVRKQPARRALRAALDREIRNHPPGDFNQALMELGACICTPRNPRCTECPLNGDCRAWAEDRTAHLPVKEPRNPIPHLAIAVAVIEDGQGRILIQQRPAEGMLGGLWEFPGGKQEPGESLEQTAIRETREETGLDIAVDAPLATVNHAYSHFRITLTAFRAHVAGGILNSPLNARWTPRCELRNYPFPKANITILNALL